MSVGTAPRVCMVSFLFFPHYSGAGAQALTLSKELAAQGTSVMFVTAGFDGDPAFEEYEGFRVFRVRLAGQGVLGLLMFWIRLFRVLFQCRREFNLIHVHGVGIHQILIGLYGKILGCETLIKVTMADVDLNFVRKGRLLGRLEQWCFLHFSRYVSLSSEITSEMKALGVPDHQIVTLPNGVDMGRFHPVSPSEKDLIRAKLQLSKKKIVTFVGMVSRRKGIDFLVKAWREVVRESPDACLLIIGPTADRDMYCQDCTFIELIRSLIDDSRLQNHVAILGERQDVELYLQASDVFVLPSQAEGLPNVLLEAMACGLPCVFTRVSSAEDIIVDGENGLLIEYGDRDSLEACLIRLLSDGGLCEKIGANAVRTIKAGYSLSMVAESYGRVYAELLGGKATP
nr:glycosyltransferase family 4 protein [Nitrospirota bacterium]